MGILDPTGGLFTDWLNSTDWWQDTAQSLDTGVTNIGNSITSAVADSATSVLPSKGEVITTAAVVIVVLVLLILFLGKVESL